MEKIAVVYWSGTGNTEIMANAVKDGCVLAGSEAELFDVGNIREFDMNKYKALAFGCPSMNREALEEVEFEPFFSEIEKELTGRKIFLFGSYGWGNGEWMRCWEKRCEENGAVFAAGSVICEDTPTADIIEKCRNAGRNLSEN